MRPIQVEWEIQPARAGNGGASPRPVAMTDVFLSFNGARMIQAFPFSIPTDTSIRKRGMQHASVKS